MLWLLAPSSGELNVSTCTVLRSVTCIVLGDGLRIVLGNVLCNGGIIRGMECDRGAQARNVHYIGSWDINEVNAGEAHQIRPGKYDGEYRARAAVVCMYMASRAGLYGRRDAGQVV